MKKLLLLLCLIAVRLNAADFPIGANPQTIHEAFVSRIADLTPQEIIAKQPPTSKVETPPKQPNAQTIWIPGYWSWAKEKQDFVWICGVWRLPPPDHFWLSGFWRFEQGGWTWVRGAWLENKLKELPKDKYIATPPPASQNEEVGAPRSTDQFWSAGYWEYDRASTKFKWLSGSWQKFNPKWIFEAAHWIWRPEGYLFVPAYWDWPIETRGLAYDCYSQEELTPTTVVRQLTSCYPDYVAECNWCRHYCPHVWQGCNCLPPWWGWDDWWSLPSGDSWWLWWWYLNNGYPYPPFVGDILDRIPPPTIIIIDTFAGLTPPIFITPNGVPTIDQWIDAINDVLSGATGPFLPPDLIDKIIDAVQKQLPNTGKDRPHGDSKGGHVNKPAPGPHEPASGPAVIPHAPAAPVEQAHVPEVPIVTPPPVIITTPPQRIVPRYQPQPIQPVYPQPPIYYPRGHGPRNNPPDIYINWGNDGRRGGHRGGRDGHHGGGHRRDGGGHKGDGHRGGDRGGHRGGDGGGNHGGGGKKYINVR